MSVCPSICPSVCLSLTIEEKLKKNDKLPNLESVLCVASEKETRMIPSTCWYKIIKHGYDT